MRLPAPANQSRRVSRFFSQTVPCFSLILLLLALWPARGSAQTQIAPKRALITQPVEESKLTVLRGNTYPLALAKYDQGAAPGSLPMQRMLLVLKRAPEQETALEALLDQQQDKSSPNYHAWLTPEQFGQQFGPADADIQAISSWLQLQGFQIAKVSNGRTVIEFTGTAAQVQRAFHTEIHKYAVKNEDHWANSSDPQIPTALVPAVAGVLTLHNFPRHAMNHVVGTFKRSKGTSALTPAGPLFTLPNFFGSDTAYGVGPYDFATIYNVSPLWNSTPPVIGTGQTIAIVGETDVDFVDLQKFRALFGITSNDPVMIVDGPDPGLQSDEIESDLDLEWSSAVAPGATIDFVVAATTDTTLGVDLAAQYIVDHNLAPVVSESYGICEAALGTAGNQFFNQLWQQAAAQGMSVFLASGDSGSAGCDRDDPAQFGLQVSGFASTPYTTTVGGTDFNDFSNPLTYFNSTNDAHQASAKSYIPEMTWNDSCTNAEFSMVTGSSNAEANCNNPRLLGAVAATGGSGGKSSCTVGDGQDIVSCSGGYAKPIWQAGTGVPNDSKRDIPDVSLFASNGFNGNFYVICSKNITESYCDASDPNGTVVGIGGTSASAPAFAGIMALIDQKTNSRQGNPNYLLYKIAAQKPASGCNSSTPPPGTCVFNDVTNGTIAMPCFTGSTIDCHTAVNGDQFGVLTGYDTGVGYDRATGLGTVNAANLVNAWSTAVVGLKGSATTLSMTPSPLSITHGAIANLNITVAPAPTGTGTPSGEVSIVTSTGMGVASFLLTNGAVTGTTGALPGGSYTVKAHYPGDATFGASDSAATAVTVSTEPSVTTAKILTADLNGNPIPFTSGPYGSFVYLRTDVAGQSGHGVASGNVTIKDNGVAIAGNPFPLNSQGNTATPNGIFTLAGGSHMITASYAGDGSFQPSSSGAVSATIVPATTSILAGTNSRQANLGTAVDLGASISATSCGNPATGTISFFSGTTQVGSTGVQTTVDSSHCMMSSGAVTVFSTTLPIGINTITAKYSGDGNYAPATSATFTTDIVIGTVLSLTSSVPTIQAGQSVTFTAKVMASMPGGPAMTGAVLFDVNGADAGSPVALQSGQAQFTTTTIPWGPAVIGAHYINDVNYARSDQVIVETVNPYMTTTAVTTSLQNSPQGQSVTFTATVTPTQQGGPALGGTLFFDANGLIESGILNLDTNGRATFSTTALPLGNSTVTVKYLGDNSHSGSMAVLTETIVVAPDFSVVANPASITITKPGQSGSTSLMLTAMNGLAGTFTLTPQCTGLPSESTCSVSPSSVTFSSSATTANVMLTVATMAPSSVAPSRRVDPPVTGPGIEIGFSVLAFVAMLGYLRKRSELRFVLSLIVLAALLTIAACGGGGGGSSAGGGGGNPGTPVGLDPNARVSFTIGSTSHSVALSVNVQ